jgi:hypothetical protein
MYSAVSPGRGKRCRFLLNSLIRKLGLALFLLRELKVDRSRLSNGSAFFPALFPERRPKMSRKLLLVVLLTPLAIAACSSTQSASAPNPQDQQAMATAQQALQTAQQAQSTANDAKSEADRMGQQSLQK